MTETEQQVHLTDSFEKNEQCDEEKTDKSELEVSDGKLKLKEQGVAEDPETEGRELNRSSPDGLLYEEDSTDHVNNNDADTVNSDKPNSTVGYFS